jgi:L-alanine-DL-glutamate epimerase-like enolase superfamily enzyme
VKIATIEAIPYALPTVRPHRLAMATITEHTLVLVRVHDDDGCEGVGEAGIIPHYGAETEHGICQDSATPMRLAFWLSPSASSRSAGRYMVQGGSRLKFHDGFS